MVTWGSMSYRYIAVVYVAVLVTTSSNQAYLVNGSVLNIHKNCVQGAHLSRKMFFASVEELQRGVPVKYVCDLYIEFLGKLGRYAAKYDEAADSLGSVCYPKSFIESLIAPDGGLYSLKKAVQLLKRRGTPPSYLPRRDYPILPAISTTLQKGLQSNFATMIVPHLASAPKAVYPSFRHSFTSTFDVLYDPRRPEACYQFWKFGTANATFVSATAFATDVIALVVRLRLLGVSEKDSFQIFLHACAFLFNGMRCMLQARRELKVPIVLWPLYATQAAILTKNINSSAIMPLRRSDVRNHFKPIIEGMSMYRSWGVGGEFRVSSEGITEFLSWDTVLFNPSTLKSIRTKLANKGRRAFPSHDVDVQSFPKREIAANSTKDGFASGRSSVRCGEGWRMEPSASKSSSEMEKCCSDLCYDSAISLSAISYSIRTCCRFCNQYRCDANSQYAREYAAVIPQFGELTETVITVMI